MNITPQKIDTLQKESYVFNDIYKKLEYLLYNINNNNFSEGGILFGTGTTIGQDNANFFWNNSLKRLGIGTNAPLDKLDVNGTSVIGRCLNTAQPTYSIVYNHDNTSYVGFQKRGKTEINPNFPSFVGLSELGSVNAALAIYTNNYPIIFGTLNQELMRFNVPTGNLLLNTTTDAGYRLDVNGTVRVSNSTTPQFKIDNPSFTNGSVRFHVTGDYGFQILDNQGYGFSSNTSGLSINSRSPNINIWTQSGNQTILNLGGQDINPLIARPRTIIQPVQSSTILFSPTSGSHIDYLFRTDGNSIFSPASGNTTYTFLQLSPVINATGTYSGIVRGLFYDPTLTSLTGTTHRAIETATGDVLFNTTSGNTLIGTSTQLANARLTVNGKIAQPTTANSPKGTATLVNGVVTISNTLATTDCFIQVNYRTGTALSGSSSILVVSSLINATSFTVTAYNTGATTTNTSDNNQIEYTISN